MSLFRSEAEFNSVMRSLMNDIVIPAAVEAVENKIMRDIKSIVDDAVKRVYHEQVVRNNEELAARLTDVIEMLARRSLHGVSEGL